MRVGECEQYNNSDCKWYYKHLSMNKYEDSQSEYDFQSIKCEYELAHDSYKRNTMST